jgi:hypothetical protein
MRCLAFNGIDSRLGELARAIFNSNRHLHIKQFVRGILILDAFADRFHELLMKAIGR